MDAARTALAEENAALKAELAVVRAKASEDMALIAAQKLRIAKLERQIYGQRSERSARLIDQLALTFADPKHAGRPAAASRCAISRISESTRSLQSNLRDCVKNQGMAEAPTSSILPRQPRD
jgi:hypothetical protein